MQPYCFKCKQKVAIRATKQVTLKNGKPATHGVCDTCGSRIFSLGKV
ncbi:DUF5679 domain-containing protein [Chloroflexota bacterium]